MSVEILANFTFLYFRGIAHLNSLMSRLRFRSSSIVTLRQFMGNLTIRVALSNAWSFGYMPDALLAMVDVSPEISRKSIFAVARLSYSNFGFIDMYVWVFVMVELILIFRPVKFIDDVFFSADCGYINNTFREVRVVLLHHPFIL